MAKKRYINTHFWEDKYIEKLDPSEKLLFLYFLTNPLTDICGIYEITIRRIGYDTGFDKDMVLKILERFTGDKKIYYIDGWIYVRNFAKHQSANENMKKGIERSMQDVPKEILAKISEINKAIETISNHSEPSELLNLNLNSNLDLNLNLSSETSSQKNEVNELIKLFEFVNPSYEKLFANKTQRSAAERLLKKWTLPKVKAIVEQVLPVINADKYSKGKSLTPLQMEDNMGYIKAYIQEKTQSSKILEV